MEPVTTNVTYISNGTEDDLKIFQSIVNSAQIDMNARESDRVMFTTPKTKYAKEGFYVEYGDDNRTQKIVVLGFTSLVLVFLLLAFHNK